MALMTFSPLPVKPCAGRTRGGEARATSSGRCTHRNGSLVQHCDAPRSVSQRAAQLSSTKRTGAVFAAASRRSYAGATGRTRLTCNSYVIETGLPLIVFTPLIASAGFAVFLSASSVFRVLTTRNFKREKTTATTQWVDQEVMLREKDIRSLTAFEAKSLITNKNYMIIDVRKPEEFQKRHVRGSVNVPLFTTSKADSPKDAIKTGILAALSMSATNENPFFVEMVRAALKEDTAGIIMVDSSEFGTLNRTMANNRATMSRSLVGIYCLLVDAPDITIPIAHCEGGIYTLYAEGLPSEPRPGV
eukprot:CAMPEP_0118920986 /NCGR_PEP_ID=MMETSP1169-20130426/394_1 /TAXON_ID=36882 /ORGANISM="Pyramimonas obovata, Strain CCMP722" /LENGTH=302 /DNA_ID=CAMNT_0006861629 /DNA_START=118 /DNA_END=1026 /DNA_ORIENTATION=+